MDNRSYVVVFSVSPAVKFPSGIDQMIHHLRWGDRTAEIIISKIERPDISGVPFEVGWRMRVSLESEDIDRAISDAADWVDLVIGMTTLSTGVGIPQIKEELVYENTENQTERKFMQFLHTDFPAPSRREITLRPLEDLLGKTAELNSEKRKRIFRAIKWYRVGILSNDVFEQFCCFWFGFESLNPLLQEHFEVKSNPTTCPKCKHKWYPFPTVSGIKNFIHSMDSDGIQIYKKAHDLRIGIVHGKESLSRQISLARELTPKLAQLLTQAIGLLLGIEELIENPKDILKPSLPLKFALEGKLVGGENGALGFNGEDPYLEIEDIEIKPKVGSDGRVFVTFAYNGKTRIGPDVELSIFAQRVYGQEVRVESSSFE